MGRSRFDSRFVDLFVPGTYGYSREDITILKDVPDFPDHRQPTRANMVCGMCLPPRCTNT